MAALRGRTPADATAVRRNLSATMGVWSLARQPLQLPTRRADDAGPGVTPPGPPTASALGALLELRELDRQRHGEAQPASSTRHIGLRRLFGICHKPMPCKMEVLRLRMEQRMRKSAAASKQLIQKGLE